MISDKKILVTKSSMPDYEEYIEAIRPLWDSHWLTNMGEYHNQLENRLCEYLDVPQISLVVNGHMALELAIQAFDFPKGSEIITTPFTFISTTHAIARNDLIPVFCDIDSNTGNIDFNQIESLITDKTVAILPVHVYGNVCNIEAIDAIAKKHNLKVIYDAAHAFGIKYNNRGIGNYGDATIFSFHATKVFNTIEGGAVVFANPQMHEKLYNLKNFGIRGEEEVAEIGANAKMNEFCAIMGLCNLNHIDQVLATRREKWDYYRKLILAIPGISMLSYDDNQTMNYSYFTIVLDNNQVPDRDSLYDYLKDNNIYSRKYFYPLTSDYDCYHKEARNSKLPVAKELSSSVLVLPFYEEIEYAQIDNIVALIADYLS